MAVANFIFTAPGPTALTVSSLTRTDTGASVAYTLTGSGTTWTLTITEPVPGLTYAYTLTATYSYGVIPPITGTIAGAAVATGYYTSYGEMCLKWGSNNIAVWSNLDNMTPRVASNLQPNQVKIQDALNETDYAINQIANLYNRQTPIPQTILTWGWLATLAAYDAGIRLYQVRGASGDQKAMKGMAGVMASKWAWLWGDDKSWRSGGKMGEFAKFFKNWQGIADAPRVTPQNNSIEIVLNPVVVPYGNQNVAIPANQIPIIPNQST